MPPFACIGETVVLTLTLTYIAMTVLRSGFVTLRHEREEKIFQNGKMRGMRASHGPHVRNGDGSKAPVLMF